MGGASNPTVTQTNTTRMNPSQQSIFDLMLPYAQRFGQSPMEMWSGPTVAGFNPLQTEAQGRALAAGPQGTALGTAGAGALSRLLDPNMIDIANNPEFQGMSGAITSNANRNLLQTILPAISSGATVSGGGYAGGSSREGLAQGKAIGDTALATNSAISNLAGSMYGTGVQAMQGAAGQVPLMQAAQLFGPEVMSAVGGQQQQMSQEQLNALIQKFYGGQTLPFIQASDLTSLLSGMPGATGVGTSTGAVPGTSPLQMMLGGAAGLGAANQLFPGLLSNIGGGISTGMGGLWSGISGGLGDLFGGLGGVAGGGGGAAGWGGLSSLFDFLPMLL